MDPQELRTLQLLDEIEKNNMPSQRHLARQLNISLGLMNSFIKRLAGKGFFKVTHIPKNRVRYILTPKGAAEKTRLTYEYIKFSYSFYKDARKKLRRILQQLENEGVRRIAFYGASDLAEIAYVSLQETNLNLVAVFDSSKTDKKFLGHTVQSESALAHDGFERILITAIENIETVRKRLDAFRVEAQKIVTIS
jgi:DNA-binding MarR family transcriptional regulator